MRCSLFLLYLVTRNNIQVLQFISLFVLYSTLNNFIHLNTKSIRSNYTSFSASPPSLRLSTPFFYVFCVFFICWVLLFVSPLLTFLALFSLGFVVVFMPPFPFSVLFLFLLLLFFPPFPSRATHSFLFFSSSKIILPSS